MLLMKKDILTKLIINKNTKKCFIFDLDGTIIFNKQFLGNDINRILKNIKDMGHEIIFATGRPFRDFQTVMPGWTHTGCLVLFSGALSMNESEVISKVCIPERNVIDLVDICHTNKLHYNVDNSYNYYHPDIFHDFYSLLDSTVGIYKANHISQVFDGTTHKVLILDSTLEIMFREYTDENNLIIKVHSYDKWLDIVPSGVDKYKAVLPFIQNFNTEDVFVFGNDFNDYELLVNFKNSIFFGEIPALKKISALNIEYDEYRQANFELLINTILKY
ncbi:MAG: HAD hydrolase family protein [Neisseriaceae bacterium]